ncbi:hypothetical protein [Herbidospora sp. RD11066]
MRDLEILFDRPPASEADLADARARFMDRAAKSRPRGGNRLKPLLAALVTALLALTAATVLRPAPAGPPRPPSAREILLRAAEVAAAQPPPKAVPGGGFFHVVMRTLNVSPESPGVVAARADEWTPVDGTGRWLRRLTPLTSTRSRAESETVYPRMCDLENPVVWSADLQAELTDYGVSRQPVGAVSRLLWATPPFPDRTAQLLRIAADLPGLTVTRDIRDAVGLPAIAVGAAEGENRVEMVFEADTLRWVGDRRTAVHERGPSKEGEVTSSRAILSVETVPYFPPRKPGVARETGQTLGPC